MSVQAGIWNFDRKPLDQRYLNSIGESVAEYGPDGETTYYDDDVGMLYRPLHTTAESRCEHQPHVSQSGKVITWDGRLDNRDELIAQLCDHLTDDRTDVAIVLAALDLWGKDSFARLIGDWSLSLWNARDKELILARDYIGAKCLFYHLRNKQVVWCSHLAPLALCGATFALRDEYVASYLASRLQGDLTPYRQIQSVPPGAFVRIHNEHVHTHQYWIFNPRLQIRYKTDREYEEHFRTLFRQAVRRRLRADAPVLADLSGGYDSSSIVCMADEIISKEGAESPSVDTFSYNYIDEPDADDSFYFTKVEQKRGRSGFQA
jgi:asparagine synthase (glutamine-hydrolysing)